MRGAEAIVKSGRFLGRSVVIKERRTKRYRAAELDQRLRTERTRQEARLLHKAKLAGVPTPIVLAVGRFSITMTKQGGRRPKMDGSNTRKAGEYLARLHAAGIIHGDYTPANLLQNKKELVVIDFGLGFFSPGIEDKAVDAYTMLKTLRPGEGKAFLRGYQKYARYAEVMKRIEQVQGRVRYA